MWAWVDRHVCTTGSFYIGLATLPLVDRVRVRIRVLSVRVVRGKAMVRKQG